MRGHRRVEITSWARAQMTRDEEAEVHATCKARGLQVSIMYSTRDRGFSAIVVGDGRIDDGIAVKPMAAFRKAMAMHDAPAEPDVEIVSLLDG